MRTSSKNGSVQKILLWVALVLYLIFPFATLMYAAEPIEYKPLVGLPGIQEGGAKSIPEYINSVYVMLIIVGSLLGVMRIAWAGVKYSLSDVVTEKSEAKHDMTGVLMGLAILLIPFVVLNEINPDLVKLDVLEEARNSSSESNGPSVGSGSQNQPASPSLDSTVASQRLRCLHKNESYNPTTGGCVPATTGDDGLSCWQGGGSYDTGTKVCTPMIDNNMFITIPSNSPNKQLLYQVWTNNCKSATNLRVAEGSDGYTTIMCIKNPSQGL